MPFKRSNTTCKKIQQPIKSFFYWCECQSPKTLNHKDVPKEKYHIRLLQKNLAFPEEARLNKNTKFCVQKPRNHTWYCLSKHTKFSVQRSWNHAWYCLSRQTKLGVQRPRNHAWYCLSKHTKFGVHRSWKHAIVLVNTCQISQGQQNRGTEAFNILHLLFLYFAKTILLSEAQNNRGCNWAQEPFPASMGVLFIGHRKILLHEHIKFITAET